MPFRGVVLMRRLAEDDYANRRVCITGIGCTRSCTRARTRRKVRLPWPSPLQVQS